MDIDRCIDSALFEAFGREEVDASSRAFMWAHAARCEKCARRLQQIAIDEDAELRTALITGSGSPLEQIRVGHKDYQRGDLLGRYVVLEPIGSGGLGQVYLGYDPDLDRRVAIKVLRAERSASSDSTLHQIRLMREAKAMAQLTHQNVVAVYDVGVSRSQVFISLEYVDGLGLRKWVSAERPAWPKIREIMLKAALALQAAHDAGLVHRDFKPSNVLVTSDHQVKVLDFGLARNIATRQDAEASVAIDDIDFEESYDDLTTPEPLSRAASLDEPLTRSGQFMGTPGYMPPEQYDTRTLVDSRSDQFAFCVTLHEMLYRRRPYRGKSFEEVRDATLNGSVADPPENIKVPAWLRALVLKGISIDPDDRFANMEELMLAMTRDQRNQKRKYLSVGAAAGLSAVIGSALTFMWSPTPVPEEVQLVELLASEARDAAARSFYVYPPAEQPALPTAYAKVIELEAIEGAAQTLADERAGELRSTFADTLVHLGDRYWAEEGGRGFATDYYLAALVFDHARDHARTRAVLTPGQIAMFEERAGSLDFSESELLAAGPLIALAETDESVRVEKLKQHYAQAPPSPAAASNLEALLGPEVVQEIVESPKAPRTRPMELNADSRPEASVEGDSAGETGEETTSDEQASDDAAAREEQARRAQEAAAAAAANSESTKKAARSKVQAAQRAFRSNQLPRASSLFHQALDLDPRNRSALAGLTELEFEQGHYREALRFGRKAVRHAPKDKQLRILLGDAYYKTVNYPAARIEYEKAAELGHPQGKARLARLDKKLGKKP